MTEGTLTAKREDLPPRQVALEVVVDEDRLQSALRSAARRVSRKLKIPGFRPGKAPHDVVVRQVGRQALLTEAIEELGPQIYREAVQAEGLEPFDRGELRVISEAPLTFRMTVPLGPRIELPDYRSWRYAPASPEVSEEQLAEAMEEVREAFAEVEPADREARFGDLLTLDIQADMDGRRVLDLKQVSFVPRPGSPGVAPGFSEAVVGMTAGEARSFELTFPQGYADEELRGKMASFQVTVHVVNERRLPPVDDELARSAGAADLAELEQRLRHNLEQRARLEAEAELAEEILQRLVDESRVEYPPIALDREVNDLAVEQAIVLRQRGFTLEGYLEAAGLSQESWREQLRGEARDRLERALVLSQVVEAEEIRVEEAEVQREVERMASRYGEQAQQARQFFGSEGSVRTIVARLYGQKALRKVVAVVTGREEELERERIRGQIAVPGQEGRTQGGIVLPGRGGGRRPRGGIVLPGGE